MVSKNNLMEEETDKQQNNSMLEHDILEKEKVKSHLLPYQWKKGQSGNPNGRPKGKTMKEYARELLACQTDEEREKFLEGIDKRTIWEMAEGKAETKTDITTNGESIQQVLVKFIDASTRETTKDDRDTDRV